MELCLHSPIYLHDEHRENMTSIPTLNDITVHPAVRCMHPIFILLITLLTFGFFLLKGPAADATDAPQP